MHERNCKRVLFSGAFEILLLAYVSLAQTPIKVWMFLTLLLYFFLKEQGLSVAQAEGAGQGHDGGDLQPLGHAPQGLVIPDLCKREGVGEMDHAVRLTHSTPASCASFL